MKCPLTLKGEWYLAGGIQVRGGECLKEECAVYDDKFQQCVAITATEQLVKIANALLRIDTKIPLGIKK